MRRTFGKTAALKDVSLDIQAGEICGIIGRSGAGKSTLIRCVNGLERPDSGIIRIEGQDISGYSDQQLLPVRRRIGMIFQHFNLLSSKTVAGNIALPLKIAGYPQEKQRKRVSELLDLVGLSDKAHQYPSQLSGGQKQRVGIARALAADPVILLSDEATSALDPETTQSILELLKSINRELGLTIMLITHEMEVIRQIADRVVVMEKGAVVEEGAVIDVFAHPKTTTTRNLLQVITPQLPEAIAKRLQNDKGDNVIIRLHISGDNARRPLFAEIAEGTGLQGYLVHGGIELVQEIPVGTLFISLPALEADKLSNALAYLNAHSDSAEVLGYVSGNA